MGSGHEPKILICVECGQEFVFTINAQEYFAERGYTEDPKRCKHCYMMHKREKRGISTSTSTSTEAEKVDLGAIYPE